MEAIEIIIDVFYLYLLAGAVFAVLFLWKGIASLDEAAKGISWKTRTLFFPGMLALWPILLRNGYRFPVIRLRKTSIKRRNFSETSSFPETGPDYDTQFT